MSSYGDNVYAKDVVASQKVKTTDVDCTKVDCTKVEASEEVKGATVESTNHIKCAVYADITARNAAIQSPATGMLCVTGTTLQFYDGAWKNVTVGTGGA